MISIFSFNGQRILFLRYFQMKHTSDINIYLCWKTISRTFPLNLSSRIHIFLLVCLFFRGFGICSIINNDVFLFAGLSFLVSGVFLYFPTLFPHSQFVINLPFFSQFCEVHESFRSNLSSEDLSLFSSGSVKISFLFSIFVFLPL